MGADPKKKEKVDQTDLEEEERHVVGDHLGEGRHDADDKSRIVSEKKGQVDISGGSLKKRNREHPSAMNQAAMKLFFGILFQFN